MCVFAGRRKTCIVSRLVVGLIHEALEDRPELFRSLGLPCGGTERAIVIEPCQSMDKRPGGDSTHLCQSRRAFIPPRQIENHTQTGLYRAFDLGILRSIEAGLKHHTEVIRMVSREAQISHSGLNNLVSKAAALFNGLVYFALKKLISIAGNLSEQRVLIVKVTIRGGNRDTGEPRGLTQ